jgi:tetratricopeptide (TPR) repeat protein
MLDAAEQAVAAAPDHEWPHRLRSIALGKLHRVAESVEAGRRAVDLSPNIWQTHVILVDALLAQGSVESLRTAYRAARQARDLAPEEPEVHNACGRLYQAISDPAAARACYGRALALDPHNSTARNNLAVVELRQGRATVAGERLRDVLAERPTEALYQRNAKATAAIWASRLMEFGTLAWLAELILAQACGSRWPLRLGLTALLLGTYVGVAALRYRRLSPALRAMVRANRFPVAMSAVQAATVAAIGLSWASNSTVARFILTPLLIVSFIVGLRSGLLLRDRGARAVGRAFRRWRYRWTVIRPVERGTA